MHYITFEILKTSLSKCEQYPIRKSSCEVDDLVVLCTHNHASTRAITIQPLALLFKFSK